MTNRMRVPSLAAFIGIASVLLWQLVPQAAQFRADLPSYEIHVN